MKGKYHIIVQNNRVHYEFDIRRNITIIRGDSATGKTTLYQMIDQATRQGVSAGIDITCEKTCRTLPVADWDIILPLLHEQIIFIGEDSTFIRTQKFAETIKFSDNYFVLITRENLPNLPYSADEIYGIHQSGKYHDLRKTYNEFYHLYGTGNSKETISPDLIITEDSNSGYDFFQALCAQKGRICRSAAGKSNLFASLRSVLSVCPAKKEILAVGDGAAIGPEMADLYLLTQKWSNVHLFLPESFEWLILKSGLVDGNKIQDILQHPEDFADSLRYFSWEQFFETLLIQETRGTYLQYQKQSLNPAYLQKKAMSAITAVMTNID